MANVHGFRDIKKDSNPPPNQGGQGGSGGPPGGFGGLGGMLGSMFGKGQSANEGNVKHFHGEEDDFRAELKNAGGRLVVVDFSANWCGPCKMIAPHFAQLSQQYTNAVFIKIDVDENNEVAAACGARSIPFFQFYKNGKKLAEFAGADPSKLKQTIDTHYTAGSSSSGSDTSKFPSGGYVLGSASSQPSTQPQTRQQPSQQDEDVDPLMLRELLDMGFSSQKASQALKATGGKSVEAAMDWCFSHPDNTEQDEEDAELKQAMALSQQTAPAPVQQPTTQAPPTSAPITDSKHTSTAIQVRMPDGNIIKASFKPTDTIRSVHAHVAMLTQNSKFSLMTNFPRKVYSPSDASMDTTLQQAELVPTGTLIVSKQ